ncbi:MAG: aspartate--tRNA ligase [Bacteroidales bacterium]|jgi:aspartyl-tRNA synthetase
MHRTHNCGELTIKNTSEKVTVAGWVQRIRNLGGLTFIDLRDRYGITQLAFNMEVNPELCEKARELGREFVIKAHGTVTERSSKNLNIPTGEIEIIVDNFQILNKSLIPPFTIEENTDGGDELRMKYRYLDLRRPPLRKNLILRHKLAFETRNYLNSCDFLEIETPVLIKSTPEGARDYVVPSRISPGEFYALPQSPQSFKQLLMISGFDKYFQIVKCFRDEDLRADRQPEFTQIDCEMSFVEQDDVLNTFEGLIKYLFKEVKNIELNEFPRMAYSEAMAKYGSDKPDIRFGMQFVELNEVLKGKGFQVFDNAEYIAGICAEGCANYSRKQLDALTDFVRKPQIGAKGMVYIKYNEDGSVRSSVDKFYTEDDLKKVADQFNAKAGDLILILSGETDHTRKALCELRLEMGNQLGLRNHDIYAPLWVVDFPLLEWNEDDKRFYAKHHPFTSPHIADIDLMDTNPAEVRANAYDMVINGVEVGGGSIRIHDKQMQNKVFELLGISNEEAEEKFGFLLKALQYGAPPHGGIAFGFDRICSLFGGSESIRDFIAFPKNNNARDVMIDSPSPISDEQLKELNLKIIANK